MKKLFTILVLISLGSIQAQYTVQSPYLQNPEIIINYVDSCAQFWMSAYDETYGGFFTNVSKTGNVISSWGRNKDMISQSRNSYGYARAFMLTGNEDYLEMARKGLEFMYDHAWDNTSGGWYNNISETGSPSNITSNKTAFLQHYALLGPAAYFEASGDTLDWNWFMKGYNKNETELWDSDPQDFGYFDNVSHNWVGKFGKSFNATVDAITTHALYLYLANEDSTYAHRLTKLTENILDHLVPSMQNQAIGFVELYDRQWNVDNSNTLTIMGHVLKTAWCLGRIHQVLPDTAFVSAAEILMQDVLDKGYDHQFGGPYKDYNRVTGQMQMWGNPDTAKAWWQMEQAIVAGLEMYDITGKDEYLKVADESLDFFMNYFVDHVYGEIYENRTRYGDETWGEHKGNGFKAGYHSIETGYYVYLYGNLFLQQKPVTLYYKFDSYNYDRTLKLTPIAIGDDRIKIKSVLKDETAYSDFAAASRTINLPAGTDGKFAVTFELTQPSAVAAIDQLPESFELYQNYPNPFNPITKIKFVVPSVETGHAPSLQVKLVVYDILGNQVATMLNEPMPAGTHEVEFDGSGLTSGVYFCTLNDGRNSSSIKMILLK